VINTYQLLAHQVWAADNNTTYTVGDGGLTQVNFTTADNTKLDGVEASADVTDATNVAAAGAVMEADTTTSSMSFVVDEDNMASNSATKIPTQQSVKAYVDSEVSGSVSGVSSVNGSTGVVVLTHDGFSDFVANEHLDWTADQGSTNIHAGNYTDTNTTYTVGDGGLTQINFTSADNTKLDGIETSADVTDVTNVTAAGALMDSELAGLAAVKATTGTFLTADQTKLDGIATSANNYSHPTGAGDKHIPTAGASVLFGRLIITITPHIVPARVLP